MKKHLYFHSSNLEQIRVLKEDPGFESVCEYSEYEYSLISKYEYGRIKTSQNYYHFIFGNPPQKKCPWCPCVNTVFIIDKSESRSEPDKLHVECANCSARGPVFNINSQMLEDENLFEYCKAALLERWSTRAPWDKDFINRYEEKSNQ